MNLVNQGRLINFINGITGVSAGGQAVVNMPVNRRYHSLSLQCTGVNYSGGTGKAITALTGTGVSATGTLTVVNGVPTAIAIVAGGSGWTVGDTFTIADDTGAGFVGTVATVTGGPPGALATATVTVAGTPTAISPISFFNSVKLLVNGVNMRDISPTEILKICIANGYLPRRGELPIFFTEPWRNLNEPPWVTSWDLFGQSTFQIQMGIASTVSNPGLVGCQEFDYQRNLRPDGKGGLIPFLQPMAHHSFTFPIVAGRNDINTLPFNFPISRMWLQGSTPGSITQVEVDQDGNKPFEATQEQILESYRQYGITFGDPTYLNQNYSTVGALKSAYQQPIYFDSAFVADFDTRWWEALKCQSSMILRVYSSVAQTLTVVMETLPGSFAS